VNNFFDSSPCKNFLLAYVSTSKTVSFTTESLEVQQFSTAGGDGCGVKFNAAVEMKNVELKLQGRVVFCPSLRRWINFVPFFPHPAPLRR
jgi:hypothetical protein